MTSVRVSGRIIAAALVVVGFVASCAQLLGGVEVEGTSVKVEPNKTDAGPGLDNKPHICELGTTQCDGRLLQLCTDNGTAWATLQQCASNALCEGSNLSTVSACIPPKCAEEQMSCDGNVLRLCNVDRSGWEKFDTCKTAAHCDAGNRQCLPAPCNPGDRRCNVGNLEKCRDDQTDWEQLDTCATNELCEATLAGTVPGLVEGNVTGTTPAGTTPPGATPPGTTPGAAGTGATGTNSSGAAGASSSGATAQGPTECRAPACLPKEVRCTSLRLEACNEGQTDFVLAEECATPVLCEASITYTGLRGSPRCVRPTCAADQHDCTAEGVLEVCNDDRDGYRTVEECIGPPFCNSVAADNGGSGCEDAPCQAGQKQCNGPQIQVCRADRTGFDPVDNGLCESRDLCNDSDPNNVHCDPPVCRRGALSGTEFRCQGATLQRCNEQETGFDTINNCATAGLCNAGLGFNGCQPPVCGPGQTRCSGDFLQVCNANRTGFDNQELCAAGTCDSALGRCADPCIVGSARCNNQGQLEECRDRLIGREITARCLSLQLCDANARTCRQPPPGCTADGVRQCVRQGAATVLQQCSNGRSAFTTVDTCSGAEVCDPNNAACDVCDQNSQATCQGNTLVTCAADGQTQSVVNCPNGCEVVANGPDRCRSCVLAAATCEGSQLAVCVARGATDEFIERRPCDSAGLCQQALTNCNSGRGGLDCRCQPGVCAPGDRDCNGAQPTACNADRTALVPNGPPCSSALNCNPKPVGACFPCSLGDVRCGPDGIMQGCLSDRSGFANLPGATPGLVRCISSNGGVASQRCAGATLVQDACESGICNADGGGCAECDPSKFQSTCATDGSVARTECIAGTIQERSCDAAGGSCSQAVCDRGSCNTASKPRSTPCTRANGSPGFCDGLASTPSCVECVSNATCDDGNPCTADSCGITGACVHNPTTGPAMGCTGTCSAGSCCGDGVVSGGEQCDGAPPQACPDGQLGSITCVNCRVVNTCVDQRCGDGTCTGPRETTATCPADCGSRCGDGAVNGTEQCEGDATQPCPDPQQTGAINCVNCQLVNNCTTPVRCGDGTCTAPGETTATCPADCGSRCGDGTVNGNEQCEGTAAQSCPVAGQIGSISCVNCQFVNTCRDAPRCGDGNVDPGEGCDTTQTQNCPPGQQGSISCVNCQLVNTCTMPPPPPRCGDGNVDPGEGCDTTQTQNCPPGQQGSISCVNCQLVNTCTTPPPPPRCGDGNVDPGEACDTTQSQACPIGQTGEIDCVNCQLVNNCVIVVVTPPPPPPPPPPPGPVCGDLSCDPGETTDNCPTDCLVTSMDRRPPRGRSGR